MEIFYTCKSVAWTYFFLLSGSKLLQKGICEFVLYIISKVMLPNQLAVVARIIRVLANNEKMDVYLFVDVDSAKKQKTKQNKTH